MTAAAHNVIFCQEAARKLVRELGQKDGGQLAVELLTVLDHVNDLNDSQLASELSDKLYDAIALLARRL